LKICLTTETLVYFLAEVNYQLILYKIKGYLQFISFK